MQLLITPQRSISKAQLVFVASGSVRGVNSGLPETHHSCRDVPGKLHAVRRREINTAPLIELSVGGQEMTATRRFYRIKDDEEQKLSVTNWTFS